MYIKLSSLYIIVCLILGKHLPKYLYKYVLEQSSRSLDMTLSFYVYYE